MRFTGNARTLHFLLKEMARDGYEEGVDTLTEPHLDDALAARGHKNDVQEGKVPEVRIGSGSLAAVEKEHIISVLAECGGNLKRTAEKLGIGYRTLSRKLEEYGKGARPGFEAERN